MKLAKAWRYDNIRYYWEVSGMPSDLPPDIVNEIILWCAEQFNTDIDPNNHRPENLAAAGVWYKTWYNNWLFTNQNDAMLFMLRWDS